jgi:apolipoprotein D and lipocalin family protein
MMIEQAFLSASVRPAIRPAGLFVGGAMVLVLACVAIPAGVAPVADFELARYLGRWYEIARLDHAFERGLTHVTADYRQQADGKVQVVNRGYRPEEGRWETAEGVAAFVGPPNVGRLKVSFFGPFYGAYTIIALDRTAYQYALVCGPSRSYLWILSRKPRLAPGVFGDLVARARALGFAVDQLIMVDQGPFGRAPDGGAG